MITYLNGTLTHLDAANAIIDCSGVGYGLRISLFTHQQLITFVNKQVKVLTWILIKEDAHQLYGFAIEEERVLFQYLISVSGIGANTAIIMLSSMHPEDLQDSIINGDTHSIQAIKGIGAKTAQRVILELSDKLKKDPIAKISANFDGNLTIPKKQSNTAKNEALSALVTLGIAKNAAEKTLDALLAKNPQLTTEDLIRNALKSA